MKNFLFAVLLCFAVSGCQTVGMLTGGNVYSEGYRDGYIVGVTAKRQGFGGLSYVGELKVSFHGFGGGASEGKDGQPSMGAWKANFFSASVYNQCEPIRGDQLVRIYYIEKDVQFNGGTNYEVSKVIVLPPAGEVPIVKKD